VTIPTTAPLDASSAGYGVDDAAPPFRHHGNGFGLTAGALPRSRKPEQRAPLGQRGVRIVRPFQPNLEVV
jgi:hypothetical protein